MTALSLLDLVRITGQADARGALIDARDLARQGNSGGYRGFGRPQERLQFVVGLPARGEPGLTGQLHVGGSLVKGAAGLPRDARR